LRNRLEISSIDRMPLQELLRAIDAAEGVSLRVDWDRLARTGILPTSRVTLRPVNLRISTILDLLDTQRICSHWLLDSGEILVTVQDCRSEDEDVLERRYDLRPIISSAGFRCFEDPHARPSDYTEYEVGDLCDAVAKLIEDTVASETWVRNGGSPGAIRWDRGWAIVRQTRENQRSVERLVGQLAQTRLDDPLAWVGRSFPR